MVQFDSPEIGVQFVMVMHSFMLPYQFSLMFIFSVWDIYIYIYIVCCLLKFHLKCENQFKIKLQ